MSPPAPALGQGHLPLNQPHPTPSRDGKPTVYQGNPFQRLTTLPARNSFPVSNPNLSSTAPPVRRCRLRAPSRRALSPRARRSGRAAAAMAAACGRLVPRGAGIALPGREHRPDPHPWALPGTPGHPRTSPLPRALPLAHRAGGRRLLAWRAGGGALSCFGGERLNMKSPVF